MYTLERPHQTALVCKMAVAADEKLPSYDRSEDLHLHREANKERKRQRMEETDTSNQSNPYEAGGTSAATATDREGLGNEKERLL